VKAFEKMEEFFSGVKSRLLVYVGHKMAHGHLVAGILGFFERHHWCYVLGWSLVLAIPIPIAWTIFAVLLSIPNDTIRAVAIWSYLITLIVLASGKDWSEKSAIDRALGTQP